MTMHFNDCPLTPNSQLCTFPSQPRVSLSARDQRKFNVALRVRRRENERLLKFMQSPQCMQHLWRIFYGEQPCERHSLYQNEVSRRSLLWTGMGPFQLDQSDDQVRCNVSGVRYCMWFQVLGVSCKFARLNEMMMSSKCVILLFFFFFSSVIACGCTVVTSSHIRFCCLSYVVQSTTRWLEGECISLMTHECMLRNVQVRTLSILF